LFKFIIIVIKVVGVSRSSKDDMLVDDEKSKQQEQQQQSDKYYIGSKNLLFRRDHMECESPFNKDGLVENFDHLERLIEHTLSSRLRIQGSEHPMLFSEAPHTSAQQREKLTQLLFEKFQIPAFFLAKSPVLSAFANGKSTALIVDSGASGTVVSPVYDGYVLSKSIVRNHFGGDWLSDQLLGFYEEKNINIRPHYSFEKKRSAQTNALELKLHDFPNTTASYRHFATRLVINDLKEATCRVSELPFDEKAAISMNLATISYELPDGTPLDVGVERFNATEMLFLPSSFREACRQPQPNIQLSSSAALNGLNQAGIKPEAAATGLVETRAPHLLAYDSIMKCENDIKKELFASIILTGGNSLFHGYAKRFETELQAKVGPNIKIKPPMSASALP